MLVPHYLFAGSNPAVCVVLPLWLEPFHQPRHFSFIFLKGFLCFQHPREKDAAVEKRSQKGGPPPLTRLGEVNSKRAGIISCQLVPLTFIPPSVHIHFCILQQLLAYTQGLRMFARVELYFSFRKVKTWYFKGT